MIDVNNTRFHLMLSERDWRAHLSGGTSSDDGDVAWDHEKSAVGLRGLLFQFPESRDADRLDASDRRGAARDRYGNWYTIDEDESGITFLPGGLTEAAPFWPIAEASCGAAGKNAGGFGPADEPPTPVAWKLRGLTVTTHHYLVVGVLEPFAGLLVFDLHAGGAPVDLRWPVADAPGSPGSLPEPEPFRPWDLSSRPDGGIWVLDRAGPLDEPAEPDVSARLWALDRYFRLECPDPAGAPHEPGESDDFKPVGGEPAWRPGSALVEGVRVHPAPGSAPPVAIETLPDDTVLLLEVHPDTGASFVSRFLCGERLATSGAIDAVLRDEWAAAIEESGTNGGHVAGPWRAHDFAFVPDRQVRPDVLTGSLFVVGTDGNQAYVLSATADRHGLELEIRHTYFPLRRFGGRGIVAAERDVFYDLGDRWLPVVAQKKPRYRSSGVVETDLVAPFDGRQPDCVWHRLMLDAQLPSETSIRVESRAANDATLLVELPWREEPALYRRSTGTEVPYYEAFETTASLPPGTGTWELLFQRAVGRHLQLRLTLTGTGRSTPRIHALRLHYPRFSYLREYLPAIYRDDDTSASFLDRFLANVEGSLTELEGRIAEAQNLFDHRTVPAQYLEWLASWLGVALDAAWDESKRRLFIKHADTLFRQRGTPRGLARAIRLALDPCPDDSLFADEAIAADIGDLRSAAPTTTATFNPFGVRLVEQFRTRSVPGVVYGDPTAAAPPILTTEETWTPAQGAEPLHAQYRTFLRGRHASDAALRTAWGDRTITRATAQLSPVPPAHEGRLADWRAFIDEEIGFTYEDVVPEDQAVWRALLVRRYRSIDALNAAHVRQHGSFADVKLPPEHAFPAGGRALFDWIQFVSLVLPIRRTAHRFTVLVPTEPLAGEAAQSAQLQLVERIVEVERPAHTSFEVKPYWAAFQVGTARLGYDTLLEDGSRYVAILLGQAYLARGHVAPAHPWDVTDRFVTGRDDAGSERTL